MSTEPTNNPLGHEKKVRLRQQREQYRFCDEQDLERIVDSTSEGVPSRPPLLSPPTVTPKRDEVSSQEHIQSLTPNDNSDAILTYSNTIKLLSESDREIWAYQNNMALINEPNLLPFPEPPPPQAVCYDQPPVLCSGGSGG